MPWVHRISIQCLRPASTAARYTQVLLPARSAPAAWITFEACGLLYLAPPGPLPDFADAAVVGLHGFAEFLIELGVPFGVLHARAAMSAFAAVLSFGVRRFRLGFRRSDFRPGDGSACTPSGCILPNRNGQCDLICCCEFHVNTVAPLCRGTYTVSGLTYRPV